MAKEKRKLTKLSLKDRLELARARGLQAGLPEEEMPISMRKKITTPEEIEEQKRLDEEQERLKKEKPVELEQERIITEERPERRQLDPLQSPAAQIPVLGGIIEAGTKALYDSFKKNIRKKGVETTVTLPSGEAVLSPEVLRNKALTAIEEKVYKEGATASEKFGLIIEGLPIIGGLIGKYGGGLIETPRGNVEQLRKTIKKERTRATKYETWSRTGELKPSVAKEQIEEIERNVQRAESRIKYLIELSPTLQYNTDEIDTIETEILSVREILLESKLRVAAIEGGTYNPSPYALMDTLESFEEE